MSCIFCQIAQGQIPSNLLHEDEEIVAFRDINPQAPTHILILPKNHISNLTEMSAEDLGLTSRMVGIANMLARKEGIDQKGYRLVINCKQEGSQTVDHLHMHLIGGKQLSGGMA